MAAAHLSKHRPDVQIFHLYDRDRPTIGVGEGTTPDFVRWLNSVGISIDQLCQTCQATHKRGILFEDWGNSQPKFDHEFFPRSDQAVHFAAARLPELLQRRSRSEHINDSAEKILSSGSRTSVLTTRGESIDVDLVIDATGFQLQSGVPVHRFDWITTDAAFVTKIPVVLNQRTTRAIARPHGWIFSIPLANETSFGYVYNSRITVSCELCADFEDFLKGEQLPSSQDFRPLSFPNFVRRRIFDGGVFHIGNSASFVEPLEATAIGITILQLHLLIHWLELIDQAVERSVAVQRINRIHEDTLIKLSVFIAWHYAAGSIHDTAFWRGAVKAFQQISQRPELGRVLAQFDAIRNASHDLSPGVIADLKTPDDIKRHFPEGLNLDNFGGYNKVSFAQLSRGLGFNLAPAHRRAS